MLPPWGGVAGARCEEGAWWLEGEGEGGGQQKGPMSQVVGSLAVGLGEVCCSGEDHRGFHLLLLL